MNNIVDVPGWLKSTDYTGPVGLTVKCYIRPEMVKEFKVLMKEHLETTFKEPGVLHFKFNSDYEFESVFWLVEEWESPAALLTHLSTSWFREQYLVRSIPMNLQPSQRALYKINN